MISEFCFNENFQFQYKISLVNELSEKLLIAQFMPFNLLNRVDWCLQVHGSAGNKCAVNSASKLR